MQELISEVDYAINKRNGESGMAGFSVEVLKIIKEEATKLLAKEKEQIVDAYLKATTDYTGLSSEDCANDYYNTIYQNQKGK